MHNEFEDFEELDLEVVGEVGKVRTHQQLAQAWDRVANTPDGLQVLQHILKMTGYQDKLMTFNPATSELNTQATIYNLSKRDVWTGIQKMLTPAQLQNIEHPISDSED